MRRGALIVLAVATAAALGFWAQRQIGGGTEPEPAAQIASASVVEAPGGAGADDAATAEPAIPETLPQFELADRDGTKRKLGEWRGRPLMVNYWATWCGPCRREIPLLNELRSGFAAQRLEIVGIAVDFREDVLDYVRETTITYPLLIGEEDGLEAVKAMGMQPAFPFTVFADSQQRIVALKVGELHRDDADLILQRLFAVDSGALPLEDARQQIAAGLKDLATRRAGGAPATP